MAVVMFAHGSNGDHEVPGQWYARNVAPMTCSRPFARSPERLLTSPMLPWIALGFPPHSLAICRIQLSHRDWARPTTDSARCTIGPQRATPLPEGTGPPPPPPPPLLVAHPAAHRSMKSVMIPCWNRPAYRDVTCRLTA